MKTAIGHASPQYLDFMPPSSALYQRQWLANLAGQIDVLPWNEMESLHTETGTIKDEIVALNKAGFLTINSQPRVNGVPSSDPAVGWGGDHG